ncbi:TPA: DUF2264 domain-containing protein [Photobacterium damselae]|uniref:DUF2264 domain-containing protein n=1 Tax=Photobacterium damselae TaxID=38293 RepID=UPI0020902B1F|nr:DUF2264 domain-containing protein [Photobacterium damselae]USR75309.1 DUF2264 domain-containing protein [Photobacterium damselae]
MTKFIQASERPHIPCENPDLKLYIQLFKQNIIKSFMKRCDFIELDEHIISVFQKNHDLKVQCEAIVDYVAEAFNHYAVWDYSHAYYPGVSSQQTARLDAMEGCSRVLPTLAAWVHSHPDMTVKKSTLSNKQLNMIDWIKSAFLAGTNPNHAGYWGKIENYNQKICESADLALALWLTKEQIWQKLTLDEQKQITVWFSQVNHIKTVDNNWHLFPLTVQLVLKQLTGKDHIESYRYERVKEFLVGDGWFRDGANGNYDYYNAWGFYYSLYWLNQVDPDFDPDFIRKNLRTFSETYRYFFTSQGFPLFGRSASYRLSATAPLIATLDLCNTEYLGQFKRAFKTNLHYFIVNGALKKGRPTQGLFSDDIRLTDNYSGPASGFWSLRGLNIALYCGDRIGLWEAKEQPLEIEKESFMFSLKGPNMLVIGVKETQEVNVIFKNDYIKEQTPLSRKLASQPILKRWQEKVSGRAERPKNNLLRKGVTSYSSKLFHFF